MNAPVIEFDGNNLKISCTFDFTEIKANAEAAILADPACKQMQINQIHRYGIDLMIKCLYDGLAGISASEQDTAAEIARLQASIDAAMEAAPTGNVDTSI
jgi:hypothetical protein